VAATISAQGIQLFIDLLRILLRWPRLALQAGIDAPQLAFGGNVSYLHGGWQPIVDGLHVRALAKDSFYCPLAVGGRSLVGGTIPFSRM
jgi:hypothetical protein